MGGPIKVRQIEVLANCASGSVGANAPAEIEKILADHGLSARVRAPEPGEIGAALVAAVDAAPDLLIVLAGDGTARTAAELAGPDGPMIAPLPGGTMNMLPHAIYGARPWQEALKLALTCGVPRPIGGGTVDGKSFLVAAVVGPPALWAPAREAARYHQLSLAWRRARVAMGRAFTGRLRYSLDAGPRAKAEALVFMCPLTSKALADDETSLEAVALDLHNATDLLRVGFHVLTGDWRAAPGIEVERCQVARVLSSGGVPATLDGELVRLKAMSEVRYTPHVARILAIPKDQM